MKKKKKKTTKKKPTKPIPCIARLTQVCVYIYIFKYATIFKKVYGTLLNISLRSG